MKKVILSLFFMTFMQALIGQTHWTPVTGIQNNMTMSAVLYINGEEQTSDSIEIGAFCGEECRAAALPYEIEGKRVFLLTIKGTTNEVITFRLYDHQSETELDYVCDTTYTLVIDDIVGNYPDWHPIHFSSPAPVLVEQTIALAAGWNWVSFNVETNIADLKAAIAGVAQAGDQPIIKSKGNGQIKKNANNDNWVGPLKQLDLSQMYKIKVDNSCVITLQSVPVDPNDHPATIKKGSNWIAYPLAVEMSVTNAFIGFTAANGDVVKGLGIGNATKRANGWTGTLKKLTPGIGYIYNSTATEDKVLVFPTNAK